MVPSDGQIPVTENERRNAWTTAFVNSNAGILNANHVRRAVRSLRAASLPPAAFVFGSGEVGRIENVTFQDSPPAPTGYQEEAVNAQEQFEQAQEIQPIEFPASSIFYTAYEDLGTTTDNTQEEAI